jgi:DNA-binding NarL/FixJ family response regulator
MIKVLLADDHGIVRTGLRLLFERIPDMEVIGEAEDGRQAVAAAKNLRPDVAILDVAMPLLNGWEAAAQIVKEGYTGVIMLSMHADESYVLRALNAGAKGYILKDKADDEIEAAVRAVAAGQPYFSAAIESTLQEDSIQRLRERSLEDSYALLTEREREVLQLLAEGKSNKEAAAVLNLSPYTVETHRTNLMQKLGLHNTAEIVLYAVRKRIVPV